MVTINNLIIVANAGRSGSTFLYHLLKDNLGDSVCLYHEDIPVQVTKPREFNQAFDDYRISEILADKELGDYLKRWKSELLKRDVIETGWTSYHLLPILRHLFADQLKVIVLYRDPWSVAMSRASMGNYHRRTWYDHAHEVSPTDPYAIAPDYPIAWDSMNHAEKCLYWWYVVYQEIDTFLQRGPSIFHAEISSEALFNGSALLKIEAALSSSTKLKMPINKAGQNEIHSFMRETFPLGNEHKYFARHSLINSYAESRFGFVYDESRIEDNAEKYRLPNNLPSKLRYQTRFWTARRSLGQLLRR